MDDNNGFLGRGWSFPPEFGNDKPTSRMAKDEEDIRQSLIILFSTNSGERFNRRYGCDLSEFVNEPITETILSIMKRKIERSIMLYEPRVELNSIHFDRSRENVGVLLIQLSYVIRQTNKTDTLDYPFYTNR